MKRVLLVLAVLIITWLITGNSVQAQVFQIGQTSEAPTIDGTVEDLWNGVASYVAVDPTTWTPKADLRSLEDCSFRWSGLWDATNLYLLIQIMDDNTTIGSQAEGSASLKDWKKVYLRTELEMDSMRFSYSPDGISWKQYGNAFWSGQLSDENNKYGFTDAMVEICVQDMVYQDKWASFDYFDYKDLKSE